MDAVTRPRPNPKQIMPRDTQYWPVYSNILGIISPTSIHQISGLGPIMRNRPGPAKPVVSGNRGLAKEKKDALGTVFLGNSKVFPEKMVFSVARHL